MFGLSERLCTNCWSAVGKRLQAIVLADGIKTDVSLAEAVTALAARTERQKRSLSKRLALQATFP
jgi:hypothetical protein